MGFSIHHHLDYKFCIIFAYFISKKIQNLLLYRLHYSFVIFGLIFYMYRMTVTAFTSYFFPFHICF